MNLKVNVFLIFLLLGQLGNSQKLRVSENNRFLETEEGKPFFWLADTAWELFHRCNKEEVDMYLQKRAEQGFNVIQAVALAELEGLNIPNSYGETPLIDNDPTRPNDKYFEHVDYVIKKAQELDLYIALLPTWGDKVNLKSWGKGPIVFNTENARHFGKWIGARYKDYDNVIWVIGGDRNPREDSDDIRIWNEMAEGVADGAGGYENTLMTFHPQPKDDGGSSTWFHKEKWLDFNMHQTGHCAQKPTYKNISYDYHLSDTKPVLDGEPLYEGHPNCFRPDEFGHSIPEDIRRIMYWNVFAGGFGQTYGCHAVWQMFTQNREGINKPLRPWTVALDLPLANQVKHLKNLMLSRPFLTRIPDQSIVIGEQEDSENYVMATRDSEGTYAMIFFPTGKPTKLNLNVLTGKSLKMWWYDTRTGYATEVGIQKKSSEVMITPPSSGKGQDWVLVLDDAKQKFKAPGKLN
ncbi:MAG: hypothetical protein COA50_07515 [Flavobacteriaceae bacterium]|nr:MAG: hypothetical protein COA50_07515 [Flavobacteriaceae bacterium]